MRDYQLKYGAVDLITFGLLFVGPVVGFVCFPNLTMSLEYLYPLIGLAALCFTPLLFRGILCLSADQKNHRILHSSSSARTGGGENPELFKLLADDLAKLILSGDDAMLLGRMVETPVSQIVSLAPLCPY